MKYKVGDIVKLRDDLEAGEYYGGIQFMEGMNYLKNKAIDIEECFEELTGDWYKVVGKWGITEKMIEGLWEECKSSEQVSKSDEQIEEYNEHTLDAWRYATESMLESKTTKLKLIDVLNKIANGELKEGTKVKVIDGGEEFTYERCITDIENHELVNKEGECIFENYHIDIILDEVELIEPQEPTECEHEWEEYGMYNTKTKEDKHFRKCIKCGLEEEIETTDNTKIEELIDWYQLIDGTTDEEKIHIVWNKLNEVIRKINKEE